MIIPGDIQATLKHLQEAHGAFICPSFGETIMLENFNRAVEIGKRQHWTPVIFTGGISGSQLAKTAFVFLAVFEPNDEFTRGSISLICAMLGDGCAPEFAQGEERVEEEKKYRVNFFIKSMHSAPEGEADMDDITDLDWTVPCAKIYNVTGLLHDMVLRTPASALLTGFMKEDCGHLEVKISIVDGDGVMLEAVEGPQEQRAVSVQG